MIWYPYAQMKTLPAPYKIINAEGVYLYTEDRKLIDSVSSWWSVIHGYKNPEMDQAIIAQVKNFSHVMLGGLTHQTALDLAEKLQTWLPGDLNYSFFSDSGSVAVEVALKMALQYYMNRSKKERNPAVALNNVHCAGSLDEMSRLQQERTMVLALEHAYHGDTFKAMEVGDDEDYHFVLEAYGKNRNIVHVPTEIDELERAFAVYGERLNSFIVEPLLQGAGGMRMYDVSFLQRARELCDQYDVLLIFDEVATGFGRTGNRVVADLVLPDIIVLGKALTGGYIGHAVTVANRKVYHGFYDDDPSCALMHGPTFMGNALACSAALKSIELFEREDYLSKIKRIEEVTRREMEGFSDPRVKEVRIMGGCVCIEVHDPETLRGYQRFAYERGVFSRPFLKYLYAMVPYIITDEELVKVLMTMKEWFRR